MQPLAERMRPKNLAEYIGQRHLVGENAVLRRAVEAGRIPSMILWGPPGVGKTTLAGIISASLNRKFYSLSAINSGVKDIRETIEEARRQQFFNTPQPILFIDEIHRFSKSQQDSLLGAVEKGIVTLIGATTENPSFEVIPALLSRCQVYVLQPLEADDLINLINTSLEQDAVLKMKNIAIKEYEAILQLSGGDARKLLNILELLTEFAPNKPILAKNKRAENQQNNQEKKEENQEDSDKNVEKTPHTPEDTEGVYWVDNELVTIIIQQNIARYDKSGEQHYDIISAFIKSMRGSDPNAVVYYLARMLEGGEDPLFIARRMVILASEDIGLANPNALLLATTTFQAVHQVGMPESRIILSQCAVYLATSAKSNSTYVAIETAIAKVKETGNLPVPLHLRNAPTKLMKELNYGKGYQYAHNYVGNFVEHDFLPKEIEGTTFYDPSVNAAETRIREQLRQQWKEKYGY
ncbi:MAG: replication-associated recombination protein A [Saprospiraceae bacterium]|nr:replication-associated recombination protein A [Saprospiraceae bacterium]